MLRKTKDREQAILLRQRGFSYREILEKIPVAKSTLSLWLRSVSLSKRQIHNLTERRINAAKKGANKRRQQRFEVTEKIKSQARNEIGKLTPREKWLIGAALYWAEGSKEKIWRGNSGVIFANSDYLMARLFKKWLIEIAHIQPTRITYELYLHSNHLHRIDEVRRKWAQELGISVKNISKVYVKRNKIGGNRKNQGNSYYGLIRIRVLSSSGLNRSLSGWVEGIVRNWGVV